MTRPATFELIEKKKNMIEIIAIWDRSGSMQGLVSDAIGGFNSFLEKAKKNSPDSRLTLVLFHDYWQVVEDGAKITAVAPLPEILRAARLHRSLRCDRGHDELGGPAFGQNRARSSTK